MIDNQTIQQLKGQYGDVYLTSIERKDYVFRTLTCGEYSHFINLELASADLEDMIVMNTVVYPYQFDMNKIKPGVISALADEILLKSGFVSIEVTNEYLEDARLDMTEAVEMMKAFVISAMPTYGYEELAGYTLKQLTRLVALAEVILNINSSVARGENIQMTLVDPQQEQEPVKKTKNFTIEDIEKANRKNANDAGFHDFDAPASDPIAQKLWQALQ